VEIPRTNRKQLSFLVQDLYSSQLGYYLIKNLNTISETSSDIDPIVFFEKLMPQCKIPKFACMNMSESWGHHGVVIATSALLANKLVDIPGPSVKYYYVWDLDWLRGQQRPYLLHHKLFHEPSLRFICRGKSHADIIKNTFNININHIMDDFNYKQLLDIVGYA
jgi:hypothetical protein